MPITNHLTKVEALRARILFTDLDGLGKEYFVIKNGKLYDEDELEVGKVVEVDYANQHK